MHLERIYDDKLAQAGWLLGCEETGEGLVVDPNRDPEPYLEAARRLHLRVVRVCETHIHADFVSGVREMAARTGARILLSGEGDDEWSYAWSEAERWTPLHDGDRFRVGTLAVDVLHTPGHTPEHLTFVVRNGSGEDGGAPVGAFTGDFVFVGDVGRPDLLERSAGVSGTSEGAARDLFRSLRRLEPFPDELEIWPGHGAGSACGRSLGSDPRSTLGRERAVNWAFGIEDEETFVRSVLEGQPSPPTYFGRTKRVNRDGPKVRGSLRVPRRLDPDAVLDRSAAGKAAGAEDVLLDVRPPAEYAAGHIPGSLSIPLNRAFTSWAGWLLPYGPEIRLVAGGEDAAREACRDLFLIGLDRVEGWWGPDALERWSEEVGPLEKAASADVRESARAVEAGAALVDVREPSEWDEERIPGAVHIPLGELPRRLDELEEERPLYLHCRGGGRSAIAQSVLLRAGREGVTNVRGGLMGWRRAGLPVEAR